MVLDTIEPLDAHFQAEKYEDIFRGYSDVLLSGASYLVHCGAYTEFSFRKLNYQTSVLRTHHCLLQMRLRIPQKIIKQITEEPINSILFPSSRKY